MEALARIRRNRAASRRAEARAEFIAKAGAWVGMVTLAIVALPMAGMVAYLIAVGTRL